MGGVTGVDYASLPFLFQIYSVPHEMWYDTFEKIQILIGQAIKKFNTKKP